MKLSETYKFVTKEIRRNDDDSRFIAIMISDAQTNLQIPHPLTEFITVKYAYRGKSLNSQLVPARIICRFLNFILESIDNKNSIFLNLSLGGLKNLSLQHGSNYISQLTNRKLSANTIRLYENVLSMFYVYLGERKYIDEQVEIEYVNSNDKRTVKSLFRRSDLQTQYPPIRKRKSKLKLKDFGDNRNQLVSRFIQTSRSIAPEISLGICLQFYGGLRRGEVVNVMRSDLEVVSHESMTVNIRDNRELLFNHLEDTSNEFPKRVNYLPPRLCNQIIMDLPIVWEVYFSHMKYLDSLSPKNNQALFINKDGNAMSGKVYERRFKKVKKRFLNELLESGMYADYILLSETYWSTHIGRGIFTNLLFDMNLSPTQIAIARGDTNINSAMEYVDEKTTIIAIKNNLSKLNELRD